MKNQNLVKLCLLLSVFLTSCNSNKHTAKSEWTFDSSEHWHECDTKGHDDKLDEANHTWNDGVITTQPTEEAEGVKTYTCTVCGATKTEPINKLPHTHTFDVANWEKDGSKHWHKSTCGHDVKLDEANHTWNDGVITTQPTEEAEGVKTYTCTVCDANRTESINKLPHTHTFDMTNWEKDDTNHWHKATCSHTEEVKDNAAHTYGEWTEKTAAGIHVDRVEQRICSVCQYTEKRTITGTAIHDPDYENIKSDATDHWFECACGEKVEIEAHTYGDYSEKTPAGVDQDKQYSRKCTVCQHEDVLTFDNTKTNGTYCVGITEAFDINGEKIVAAQVFRGTIHAGDNLTFDGVNGGFSIDKIIKNKKSVDSASYGEKVNLTISEESGDLSQITNPKVCGRLAYDPDTANVHTTFSAQIKIDKSNFSGHLTAGRSVELDLYNLGYGLMPYGLVLPEGVKELDDGESYVVNVTLPDNASRQLWAGMEFTYKVHDSTTSSKIIIATGIILSVIA